jgi:hypothetical protein
MCKLMLLEGIPIAFHVHYQNLWIRCMVYAFATGSLMGIIMGSFDLQVGTFSVMAILMLPVPTVE